MNLQRETSFANVKADLIQSVTAGFQDCYTRREVRKTSQSPAEFSLDPAGARIHAAVLWFLRRACRINKRPAARLCLLQKLPLGQTAVGS